MSKEIFLMPSAKQILSYENGDISSDVIPSIYRFHFLRTYLWIESSMKGYDIKLRGTMPGIDGEHVFVDRAKTVSSCQDLFTAVCTFSHMVSDVVKLYDIHIKDSFPFGITLTTGE